jgi:hypothetical protein
MVQMQKGTPLSGVPFFLLGVLPREDFIFGHFSRLTVESICGRGWACSLASRRDDLLRRKDYSTFTKMQFSLTSLSVTLAHFGWCPPTMDPKGTS